MRHLRHLTTAMMNKIKNKNKKTSKENIKKKKKGNQEQVKKKKGKSRTSKIVLKVTAALKQNPPSVIQYLKRNKKRLRLMAVKNKKRKKEQEN